MLYVNFLIIVIIVFLVFRSVKFYFYNTLKNKRVKLSYEDHNNEMAIFFPLKGTIEGKYGNFFSFYISIKLDENIKENDLKIDTIFVRERLFLDIITPGKITQVFFNVERENSIELIMWASIEIIKG